LEQDPTHLHFEEIDDYIGDEEGLGDRGHGIPIFIGRRVRPAEQEIVCMLPFGTVAWPTGLQMHSVHFQIEAYA
jgi:hypothetical protein